MDFRFVRELERGAIFKRANANFWCGVKSGTEVKTCASLAWLFGNHSAQLSPEALDFGELLLDAFEEG